MRFLHHGHAAGHVRDTFIAAAEAFAGWRPGHSEPEVEYEAAGEQQQIRISRACDLLWNCTDVIPGDVFLTLQDCGIAIGRQTYAACARAMKASLAA